jgi:hypothetical protein
MVLEELVAKEKDISDVFGQMVETPRSGESIFEVK